MKIVDAKPLPGYQEPYGLLCAILQDGTNEWRLEMNPNISEDAIVWQPCAKAHSVGAVILHMIMAETFWFDRFALGIPFDPEEWKLILAEQIDVDNGLWPEPPRQPLSWYFELQDRVRTRTLEAVKRWPSAEEHKPLDGSERTMRWVLGHVIQHEAYHGGQAVLLQELWKKGVR